MFEEEHHYANRRFGFKVIAIHGDRILVIKDDGQHVVLSHSLQARIQESIERQNSQPNPHYPRMSSGGNSINHRVISERQVELLAKYREYKAGGILSECITCQVHTLIFDVDELREFFLIHPGHKTRTNDGYHDSNEIDLILREIKRNYRPWKSSGRS